MPKPIPTLGLQNWGTPLNDHLKQISNPTTGGINTATDSTTRPNTLLTADDGYTTLNQRTGNLHRWNGAAWDVQNNSIYNVLDYGVKGDGIADETPALTALIATLRTRFTATGKHQTLYFPFGTYLISGSIQLIQGVSMHMENNVVIKAHSTWVNTNLAGTIALDALIITDPNTARYAEHQFVTGRGFLDCASLANNALKIVRARKCSFMNFHVLRPLKEGILVIDNGVSTSYECRLMNLYLSMMFFNASGQETNVVNNADSIAISMTRATDFHVQDVLIMGFRVGTRTYAGSGANFFSLVHVWNRPQNGFLTHCFWIEGQTEFYTQCYADSPTNAIGSDSYGFYINQTANNIDSCVVYGNDSIAGGLPYGNDNQIIGIFGGPLSNVAGQCVIKNCRFVGSVAARLKSDLQNCNAAFILGNFANTQVIATPGSTNRIAKGYLYRTNGSGSMEMQVVTQGATFNGVQTDFDAYPQNNNASTHDGIFNFFRRTGTTGLVQFNIWKGNSTNNTTPSTIIMHAFRKSLSWISNQFGTDPDVGGIVFGLDSNSARGAGSVAEFRKKVVFSDLVALPEYNVASLPTTAAGAIRGCKAWAINGRKSGEAAGAGTGIEVVFNGTNWLRCTDYSIAAA